MKNIGQSIRMVILLSLILGLIYPLSLTLISKVIAPSRESGCFILKGDQVVGSCLIGQKFTDNKYFWGRPSASDYNALASGGSNLGPTSKTLLSQVKERKAKLLEGQNSESIKIPSELLYASGSGLDPHLSLNAAYFQVDRIVKARGFNEEQKKDIYNMIDKHTMDRQFYLFGNPYVNVLELNLALDELETSKKP